MATTVKVACYKSKVLSNNESPLMLRVTKDRKRESISMFDFHNLLTEANKSSYIDSYLQRAVNATEVSVGINNALHGDMK